MSTPIIPSPYPKPPFKVRTTSDASIPGYGMLPAGSIIHVEKVLRHRCRGRVTTLGMLSAPIAVPMDICEVIPPEPPAKPAPITAKQAAQHLLGQARITLDNNILQTVRLDMDTFMVHDDAGTLTSGHARALRDAVDWAYHELVRMETLKEVVKGA